MRTMGTMLIGNKLCLLGTIDADLEQVILIGKIYDLRLIGNNGYNADWEHRI